jgi:hypothetical protein
MLRAFFIFYWWIVFILLSGTLIFSHFHSQSRCIYNCSQHEQMMYLQFNPFTFHCIYNLNSHLFSLFHSHNLSYGNWTLFVLVTLWRFNRVVVDTTLTSWRVEMYIHYLFMMWSLYQIVYTTRTSLTIWNLRDKVHSFQRLMEVNHLKLWNFAKIKKFFKKIKWYVCHFCNKKRQILKIYFLNLNNTE